MALLSGSSHYERLVDERGLPSLEALQLEFCRERYRRIDRFILLAVIGATQCARAGELRRDCGLYVSSAVGPLGSNVLVQEQMVRQHLLPKPFHFVNTLGSAVGYYVARNLELTGHSAFVSRRGGAFLSALALACADLESGAVPQALVGAVDECVVPLEEHRAQMGLASDAPCGESSTWVLLEPHTAARAARRLDILRADDWSGARELLSRTLAADDTVAFGARVDVAQARERLGGLSGARFDHSAIESASRDGVRVGRFVSSAPRGALHLIGPGGRTLLRIGAELDGARDRARPS
ncbi:MAG: hypothetical protein IT454_17950 [Planctomycetes bacterium]|nr:hypothetical protein [Planctomycetota bacterium]